MNFFQHSSLLASLAFLALALPSSAQTAKEASALAAYLTPRLDKQLKKETGMRELGTKVVAKAGPGHVDLSVPDYIERSTVFSVRVTFEGKGARLTGKVWNKDESALVEQAVQTVLHGAIHNELATFPYAGQSAYAVFVPPVSNLGAKPGSASGANLATQARSGELASIIERSRDGSQLRVREDSDGYISWARAADLRMLSASEYQHFHDAPKAILKIDLKSPALPLATQLPNLGSQGDQVSLESAQGSPVLVPAKALGPRPGSAQEILKTAQEFLPGQIRAAGNYLWGGSASGRFDCSGFVQTVYRLCGHQLPRDADQQLAFCKPVAPTLNQIDELQPGDLIFFSAKREYPDHMGIYLGSDRFIHCSAHGDYSGCKISVLRGGQDYDKKLQSEYFGGGRPPF